MSLHISFNEHDTHCRAAACNGRRSLGAPPGAVLPEVVDADYQSMLIGSDHLLHSLAVLLLRTRGDTRETSVSNVSCPWGHRQQLLIELFFNTKLMYFIYIFVKKLQVLALKFA